MTRRVFVVDDSAFVRRALTRILDRATGYHVVGEAADAVEALERIPALDPDLVTLDVAMPGMDGLQLLRALLRWNPRLRVLMLSAHTRQGAAATVEALSAGAVDFIDKSSFNVMDLESLRREVVEKMDACAHRAMPPNGARTPGALEPSAAAHCALCVIGASTGGPAALQRRWSRSPPPFPSRSWWCSTLPVGFTRPFADRLRGLCRLDVAEAVEGELADAGEGAVAPAGVHLRITGNLALVLSAEPAGARHVPSIDLTMKSAEAGAAGPRSGHPAHGHGRGRCRGDAGDPGRGRTHHRRERGELRGVRDAPGSLERVGRCRSCRCPRSPGS